MLISAGFVDVKEEDRWWDPEAPQGARKKRPDVTGIHPKTHVRWIFDVTVAWSLIGDPIIFSVGRAPHIYSWRETVMCG